MIDRRHPTHATQHTPLEPAPAIAHRSRAPNLRPTAVSIVLVYRVAIVALALVARCREHPERPRATRLSQAPARTDAHTTQPTPPAVLEPLATDEDFIDLPVARRASAVVSVPAGATAATPVIITAHGSFDRPEWQCASWRRIVGDLAFVLCLRGVLLSSTRWSSAPRYTFEGEAALHAESRDALAALRARFGAYVDDRRVIFSGFSLGAMLAPGACARWPSPYAHMILIEGGSSAMSRETARACARRGVRSTLFVCGRSACLLEARASAARAQREGLAASVAFGPGTGHHYIGQVERAIRAALPALTRETFGAHFDAR